MIPKIRRENFDIESLRNGLIVTDRISKISTLLNEIEAEVWKSCDGERSPWEIGKLLRSEHNINLSEDEIWAILTRLDSLELLIDDGDDSLERHIDRLPPIMVGEVAFSPG